MGADLKFHCSKCGCSLEAKPISADIRNGIVFNVTPCKNCSTKINTIGKLYMDLGKFIYENQSKLYNIVDALKNLELNGKKGGGFMDLFDSFINDIDDYEEDFDEDDE